MDNGSDNDLRALMRQAQAGNGAAYRQLLAALTPVIRGVIYKRRSFLSEEDREDLVQDVLLSIHSVRTTYDPDRPFVPWLMAIVRHRLADRARQDARRGKVMEVAEEFHETFPALGANNADAGIGDDEALRDAVIGLPAGQRQAIELVKLKELSLREASEQSGASIASLKVSIHRAVKVLRLQLKKTDDE